MKIFLGAIVVMSFSVIILCLQALTHLTGRCFLISFPFEKFDAKIKELGMDYLRQIHNLQQGLTWRDALVNIPDELWEAHGFHKPDGDWDCLNAITVRKSADAYLIPSREVRLMQAASQMTMYLVDNLDPEALELSPDGLRERISDFVLIWAPRFVDFGDSDLWEFTERALETQAL